MNIRRRRLGLGMRLTIATVMVMAVTYLMGITYELPRLWIAFLPTLTLGVMMDRGLVKENAAPRTRRRINMRRAAVWPLLLIAGVQIGFSALHWTLLDARESEYRLLSERLFN
jgi:hypothetical protein